MAALAFTVHRLTPAALDERRTPFTIHRL